MIVCRFSSLDIIYVKPMKKNLVRLTGLAPALRKQLDPKSSASTNSATGAKSDCKVNKKIY